MKVNDLLKAEIVDLALGGKALARHEGRAVFVDRGLPGDLLEARVVRVKRGWAEARLERIEASSPLRVEAPCPHFRSGVCGGCRFQDLAYAQQLAAKERQVREALVHLGGFADPRVLPIRPAPETFRYRNKMEFSFHPDRDGLPVLGLHERGTFDRIFPLETCFLPSELTVGIVRATAAFARQHRWPAWEPRRHTGLVRHLVVRHLPHTDACGVHLVASSTDVPELEAWARGIAGLSPAVRTVTLLIQRSPANVAVGEAEHVLTGDGILIERLLGLEFEASANTFLQTNSRQAEALYEAALAEARLDERSTLLDLYCGTGTLTLLAARRAGRAFGVETVPEAIERATRNAHRNGIDNVGFVAGDARRVLREWARGERPTPWTGGGPDVVMVDPPRAGLHPRVVARIAELRPRRIVYVSCNPATFARDAKDFGARGYALEPVTPFDMFPHTPHIECVASLVPSGISGEG